MFDEIVKRGVKFALIDIKGNFIQGNMEEQEFSELMKAYHISDYVLTNYYAESPKAIEIELEGNKFLLLYLYKKGTFVLFYASNREQRAVVKKYFER